MRKTIAKELDFNSQKCDEICNDMLFEGATHEQITSINHYVRNYFMLLESDILNNRKTVEFDMTAIHQAIKILQDDEKKLIADNLVELESNTLNALEGIREIHSTILSIIIN